MPKAVLLFSGALDSMLAARLLQLQGVEVAALFVRTPWGCGNHDPEAAASRLGLSLAIATTDDTYFEHLCPIARHAEKATKLCGECHLYLARRARQHLDEIGADFVATGDVLGQRAANQKRIDFERFADHSGLANRLLWPLSARHLTPSLAEEQGWVDRDRLEAFCGRSRSGLKALARELGIPEHDSGQHGCTLGQTGEFGQRVLEQIRRGVRLHSADCELLHIGHHVTVEPETRIIVGRRAAENDSLERHWSNADSSASYMLRPLDFPGPSALLIGPASPGALDLAISTILRYAKRPPGGAGKISAVDRYGNERLVDCQFPETKSG